MIFNLLAKWLLQCISLCWNVPLCVGDWMRQWCQWCVGSPAWSQKTSLTFHARSSSLRRRWKTLSRQWRTSARPSRQPTSTSTTDGCPSSAPRFDLRPHLDRTAVSWNRSHCSQLSLFETQCSIFSIISVQFQFLVVSLRHRSASTVAFNFIEFNAAYFSLSIIQLLRHTTRSK